jgi:hypothetical protein
MLVEGFEGVRNRKVCACEGQAFAIGEDGQVIS